MQKYRVAVLGCRGRGTAAGRAYHQHPRTEVVALCDLVPERLATLGDELGVAARYDDLDRMIEAEAPDIVAIPTGTEFHYPLAMRVLEHGVHIDIEKPICTTLAEADAVLAKAAEQGVQVAVHHQGRSGGALQAVKAAVDEGRIGDLRFIQGSGKGYYGGYGLMNIATHSLNAMLGVAGPVRSVQAVALTDGRPITPEDVVPSPSGMGYIAGEHVTAALAFEGGFSGVLLQHRFPVMDSTAYMIEIYGTEGRLYWKSDAPWFLSTPHFAPGQAEWQPLAPIVPEHYDPAGPASVEDYQFADEYVRALDEGRAHECSGDAGRHVLEILMGISSRARAAGVWICRKRNAITRSCAGARNTVWACPVRCRAPIRNGSPRKTAVWAGVRASRRAFPNHPPRPYPANPPTPIIRSILPPRIAAISSSSRNGQ